MLKPMRVCCPAEYLVTGSNSLGVWDMNTTQLLFTLDAPVTSAGSPGMSSSSSSASLAATQTAAAAAGAAATTAAATTAAADPDLDDDEDLLQNGWLLQDDDSDSDLSVGDDDVAVGPNAGAHQQPSLTAAAGGASSRAPAVAPWTSISCHGNILAAGEACALAGLGARCFCCFLFCLWLFNVYFVVQHPGLHWNVWRVRSLVHGQSIQS